MKDFSGLVLCDYRNDRVEVHVRANMKDGALTIEGQDLGPFVKEVWGDSDYEYWYSFDAESTAALIKAMGGEKDPQGELRRRFSGEDGCRKLRCFCELNRITFQFNSYA